MGRSAYIRPRQSNDFLSLEVGTQVYELLEMPWGWCYKAAPSSDAVHPWSSQSHRDIKKTAKHLETLSNRTMPSPLLGHAHGLAAPASGLGVLALNAQAPVMSQTTMVAARAQAHCR